MKQYRFLLFFMFVIALLLATTQAFASPANVPPVKNTPGTKDKAPKSIQAGMSVMIQAIRDQSYHLVALRVMAIPGKPSKIHRVGIVTEYTAGKSITIKDKKGDTYSFTLNSDTKLLPAERVDSLAVGSLVTIIAPRDPASGGVTVKGIVIHPAKP